MARGTAAAAQQGEPIPRPFGKLMGRQPVPCQWTPSKSQPWYGIIIEGERFTKQQLHILKRRAIDPATAEAITVTRYADMTETWWPSRSPKPIFQFECPVVHRCHDGRIRVVRPDGTEGLVYADGWNTPPPTKRRNW